MKIDTARPHHWRQISREPALAALPLEGDEQADFVVIGGGYTGLSAALAIASAGRSVMVLEADYVGAGASGRNNGMVVPHHSRNTPAEIEAMLGSRLGPRYNEMVAGAAEETFGLIERCEIACDPVQNGWMQPAHSRAALERGRAVHDGWRAFGAKVEWIDRDSMARKMGSPGYLGGWKAASGGHINPFAYVTGLGRVARAAGARIHEGTPVVAVARDGKYWSVKTRSGAVRASKVLIATNGLTGNFWPHLAQAFIPVKIYQVATKPLDTEARGTILPGNEAASDTRKDIWAFHYDANGGLVSGGTHSIWHCAEERGKASVGRMLRKSFPSLGTIEFASYWEGVIAVVPDRLPRVMRLADGVIFAGAYSGRGVALSTVLGGLVGRWMNETLDDSDLPTPVTELRRIPAHRVAVTAARFIHPVHRALDAI